MSSFDLFQSERLRLRAFEPEDISSLHAILNHPELAGRRNLPWGFPADFPLSKSQIEKVLHRWGEDEKSVHLAIELNSGQELAGYTDCEWEWDPHHPSLSVVISPEYQRRGFGAETAVLMLRYLFGNTPAHNISGWIPDWNLAGLEFALHLGFRESGRFRREGLRNGKYSDVIVLDLLRPEWIAFTRSIEENSKAKGA